MNAKYEISRKTSIFNKLHNAAITGLSTIGYCESSYKLGRYCMLNRLLRLFAALLIFGMTSYSS